VLEIAATWINKNSESDLSIDSISEKLTKGVNECGFKFNLDTGAPAYVKNPNAENGNLKLDIYTFNQDFKSKKMPEFGVSSLDCSLLLATLARLHGVKLNQVTLSGGKFNQGFHINDVQPIGYDKWMQPYANITDPVGFLGYHSVVVKDDLLNNWYNLDIYDACFKLNDGVGNAVMPVKKVMGLISSDQNVSPLDALTYRGLLVKTGEINYVLMPVTTMWEVITEKKDELFSFGLIKNKHK